MAIFYFSHRKMHRVTQGTVLCVLFVLFALDFSLTSTIFYDKMKMGDKNAKTSAKEKRNGNLPRNATRDKSTADIRGSRGLLEICRDIEQLSSG